MRSFRSVLRSLRVPRVTSLWRLGTTTLPSLLLTIGAASAAPSSNARALFEKAQELQRKKAKESEVAALYKEAADAGHPDAQYEYGCWQQIQGNMKEAVEYWERAAKQDHPRAMYNLAIATLQGHGVAEDVGKAVALMKDCAERLRNPQALFLLANAYLDGWGAFIPKDEARGAQLAKEAADAGSPEAAMLYASCLVTGTGVTKDAAKGVSLIQTLAEKGDPAAQYAVGTILLLGEAGVKQDVAQAIKWFEKSASAGHPIAQLELGRCYELGTGVRKDEKKALHLYQQSAKSGNPAAMRNLAEVYLEGRLAPINLREAASLLHAAAQRGDEIAALRLGDLFAEGLGVPKDIGRAVMLYQVAAEAGNPDAQEKLVRIQRGQQPTN